jgi:hypothetical protein
LRDRATARALLASGRVEAVRALPSLWWRYPVVPGGRVLCVDDEGDAAGLLRDLFGVEAVAVSGVEALDGVAGPFDAALLVIGAMALEDRAVWARAIGLRLAAGATVVVEMTGAADGGVALEMLAALGCGDRVLLDVTDLAPELEDGLDRGAPLERFVGIGTTSRRTMRAGLDQLAVGAPPPLIRADMAVEPGQGVTIEGSGARGTSDLLGWQLWVGDAPCLGCYAIWPDGRWRFTGRALGLGGAILRVRPTQDFAVADGDWLRWLRRKPAPPVIERITVAEAPARILEDDLPMAMGLHVAGARPGAGWHQREMGEGPFRWMSERAEMRVELAPAVARRMVIFGEGAVPLEAGEPLALLADGVAVALEVARPGKGWRGWSASAVVPGAASRFELVAGAGVARSPRDFAGVDDGRMLSFAVRAVAWDVV